MHTGGRASFDRTSEDGCLYVVCRAESKKGRPGGGLSILNKNKNFYDVTPAPACGVAAAAVAAAASFRIR